MTHSIAWDTLHIATKDDSAEIFLVRRFQLIADDLGDRIYEGSIGLQLSENFTYKQYQAMAVKRVLLYVLSSEAVVMIETREELEAMAPYLDEVVATFRRKLDC